MYCNNRKYVDLIDDNKILLISRNYCYKTSITYRKNFDVEDDEMEGEGESHGANQPHVAPWRHCDE